MADTWEIDFKDKCVVSFFKYYKSSIFIVSMLLLNERVWNNHGINLNFGTNLSFQRFPFIIHIGYDLKPRAWALGFNWKIK